MSYDKKIWGELIQHPDEFVFRGTIAPILPLALTEVTALLAGRWSLDDYEIMGGISEDEQQGTISFLPALPSGSGDATAAAQGSTMMPPVGVTYVYSLTDLKLISTAYLP